MIGAIIGDVVGSVYEFNPIKSKEFPLFSKESHFTDDTVMSIAIAKALLEAKEYREETIKKAFIEQMKFYGRRHNKAGYGNNFKNWLDTDTTKPYNSYGNGSAMRVSSIAWLFDDLQQARNVARWSAEVTHDHPEGIKGAEAIVSAIHMARFQATRDDIKKYIEEEFGYDLNHKIDDLRPDYTFDVSCQGSVPQAIMCFLQSKDYEDCIRNAISLGGDSDTIACMAGGIARAYFGCPVQFEVMAISFLTPDLNAVLDQFNAKIKHPNPAFVFNQPLVKTIHEFTEDKSQQNGVKVLESLRFLLNHRGRFMISTTPMKKEDRVEYKYNKIETTKKKFYYSAFTDPSQIKPEIDKAMLSMSIDQLLSAVMKDESIDGFILNPWKEKFVFTKVMILEIDRVNRQMAEKVN